MEFEVFCKISVFFFADILDIFILTKVFFLTDILTVIDDISLKIPNHKSKRKNNNKKKNFKSHIVPHYRWNFHKPDMLPCFSHMTLGSKRVMISIRTKMKDIGYQNLYNMSAYLRCETFSTLSP